LLSGGTGLRGYKILSSLLIAVASFLFFLGSIQFLLWFLFDSSIADYIPTSIDFLQYWKEVYVFRNCLMHTGYFGHEELLSTLVKLGIDSPGASHGIGNSLFYSIFALFSWHFDTPIYVNLALTSLGLGLYFLFADLPSRRMKEALLVFFSCYPIYLLNAQHSAQSVHIFLACLIAGLLSRLVATENLKTRWHLWLGLLAAVAFGALLRKNWALLLVSLAFLPLASGKRRVALVVCALAGVAVLSLGFDVTRSPYPYPEFAEDLRPLVLPALAKGDISVLWKQLVINCNGFAAFAAKRDFDTLYGLFLLVAGVVLLLTLLPCDNRRRLRIFGLTALAISVVSSAAMYYIFQVMLLKIALQVFLVVVLASMRYINRRYIAAFVLVNILLLPAFVQRSYLLGEEYLYSEEKKQSIEQFRRQTSLFFNEVSQDRWKNTVLIFAYLPELHGLPPCINVMDTWESFLRERDYRVRTGFVLVSDATLEQRLLAKNSMRFLVSTTIGKLYAVD
jgi:hypothetical protein